jgi:peptidoglycan hydrolase CwlO-like protein
MQLNNTSAKEDLIVDMLEAFNKDKILTLIETLDDFITELKKEKDYLEHQVEELQFQLEERNDEIVDLQKRLSYFE